MKAEATNKIRFMTTCENHYWLKCILSPTIKGTKSNTDNYSNHRAEPEKVAIIALSRNSDESNLKQLEITVVIMN